MDHILKCHEIVDIGLLRGQDCYLYDKDGQRYIDFESGIWCTALGHSHPRITRVLQAQCERLMHLGTRHPSPLAEEAARALLDTLALPGGKCVFLSSGSEAVEFAAQAARRLSGRPLLLTLADSYLAAYGSAGRKAAAEWVSFDWGACAACSRADICDPQCSRLAELPFERIGGLVFEPGNSSGLVKFPPAGLLQTLVALVKRAGGLLVVNEVTTGLGRTGAWYGFQHYGLQPDAVALGKGLGNGYPVSAVALANPVAAQLEQSGLRYAQSHQNDPLGCAIAAEVLAVLREEGLVARGERVGRSFLAGLAQLAERHASVKALRGRGLMIALELADVPAGALGRQLLARGFLVGAHPVANLLRFMPPLTIAEEDIGRLLAALDELLAEGGSEVGGGGRIAITPQPAAIDIIAIGFTLVTGP